MKRESPTQAAMSLFMALFVVTLLTIAGCSTSTLSGPDLDAPDETTLQEAPPTYSPGAVHNEEDGAGKKKGKKKSSSGRSGECKSTACNGGNSGISGNAYRNSG